MITRLMARKRKAEGNALEFASLTPKRRSTRKQGRLKKRNKYRVHLSDSISIFHDQKLSKHGEIYEGEQRHGDFASLTIAVKVVDQNELTEAKILAKLNHHSHVISLIDSGFYHNGFVNRVYMALDKCHKENLREFVTNRKKQGILFDINRTTEIANQIIEGVEYIHSKKIIHKDLKPDNILFSLDQKMIKIADFGLSGEIDSVSAEVSVKEHFGTAGYRPPESFGNSIISLKSDIYSLGIIFYYILSNGEHPFGDDPDDWNSKMKNGVFDLSKLLVTNLKTTKHLIECMIEIKLSNRPTIWQVSLHPCWSGNEVECSFDYHCDGTSDTPTCGEEEASDHNIGDLWKLVEMLEKRTRVGKEKNPEFRTREPENRKMEEHNEEAGIHQDGQQASTSRRMITRSWSRVDDSEKRRVIQHQLVLLLHAYKCSKNQEGNCLLPHCQTMKNVWRHMNVCTTGRSCQVAHCASSQQIIAHWRACNHHDCVICAPLYSIPQASTGSTSRVQATEMSTQLQ